MQEGKIEYCPHNNCGFKCCNFNQGNYILMFPGELDKALSEGKSLSHLEIIERDHLNGHKVICSAKDTATCDNGYKPLDCRFYPFFPKLDKNRISLIRGTKCPLPTSLITLHAEFVYKITQSLIDENPDEIVSWLKDVEMVGYTDVKIIPKRKIDI